MTETWRCSWRAWGSHEERVDHETRAEAEAQQAELAFAGIDALVYPVWVEASA